MNKWKTILPCMALLVNTGIASADYAKGMAEYRAKNYASALYEWLQSAEMGDEKSQYWLGMMYESGRGAQKSQLDKALKWYQLSADSNYPPAQIKLGELYLAGKGVKKDLSQSVFWYQQAAKQNQPLAQFQVGLFYLEGVGVDKNEREAAKWLEAAARQNVTAAQNNLAWLYENGRGIKQDYAKALEWYQRAAKAGDGFAQNSLGVMYTNGKGVDQNYAWAAFWFAMAEKSGNAQATNNMAKVVTHLRHLKVNSRSANIRAGTDMRYPVIARVAYGTSLPVLGKTESGWSQVYYAEQKSLGWISSSLLEE